MERSSLIVGIAVFFAALLVAVGVGQWAYLDKGYSLGVSIGGGPVSISHIDFPGWRKVAQIILCTAAFIALWLFANGRRGASPVAWIVLAAAMSLGVSDVLQYGAIGSPTSKWSILVFIGLALVVQYRSSMQRLGDSVR